MKKDLHTIIGENVRKARKARGMTQGDLGEIINCTTAWICQYEKGWPIPINRFIQIARALRVSPGELIYDLQNSERRRNNKGNGNRPEETQGQDETVAGASGGKSRD